MLALDLDLAGFKGVFLDRRTRRHGILAFVIGLA
jgi:hypothetical protein